jgi:hypothetical protein
MSIHTRTRKTLVALGFGLTIALSAGCNGDASGSADGSTLQEQGVLGAAPSAEPQPTVVAAVPEPAATTAVPKTAPTRKPSQKATTAPTRPPSPKAKHKVTTTPKPAANCDPSYPDFCIPPAPPDLDCPDIAHKDFTVRGSDPHGFDRDRDGIGCES